MLSKRLLIAGGILNTLFFLFHIFLGYQMQRLAELPPPYLGLFEALNFGGVFFLFFFAYASFFHGKELLRTGLGRAVLILATALYLSRAAEEFFLFKFTPAVFGACALAGAIYATLFVIARNEKRHTVLTRHGAAAEPAREAQKLHPAA